MEGVEREVFNQVKAATIGKSANHDASTMLSQSLLGPVFRKILSQDDVKKDIDIREKAMEIYKGNRAVASTSEILSGYYHTRTARTAFELIVGKPGEKKMYSDPLAFAIGYSTEQIEAGPPTMSDLHTSYNNIARELFKGKGVPLFGYIRELPDEKEKGLYTGGLETPLVVAGQLTNWWFLRPTHQKARGLFQAVRGYIENQPDRTSGKDMLILEQAARDMIQAKKGATLWGTDDATKIFAIWKGLEPVEARPLGSESAVNDAMDLDEEAISDVKAIRDRTVDNDDVKEAIKDFYVEAADAKTRKEAIKSAAQLLLQLIDLDRGYMGKTKQVVTLTKENQSLEKLRSTLASKLTDLTAKFSHELGPIPGGQKLESPRLGHDAAALIFQHSHPEILTQVFAKETVDHFDSIASNLYIDEDHDEGPLVVSSSATGEITQWLL
jgi:hypothetical protein